MKRWIILGFLAAWVHAAPDKINLPAQPSTAAQEDAVAPSAEPISTTVSDATNKVWKEYDNRIVKVHVRIQAAWNVIEVKETKDVGSVSLTLSHAPGDLVTFSVTRSPLDVPFDVWMSSSSLAALYPSGYQTSHAELAGRKCTLIKGTVPDGRYEESYFNAHGQSITQVAFTAPKESWKNNPTTFAALKQSFRWLP